MAGLMIKVFEYYSEPHKDGCNPGQGGEASGCNCGAYDHNMKVDYLIKILKKFT